MKKQKFSFVKWLTTRDIEKITNMLGFELLESKNSSKKRIIRSKDEDGYHIVAFCKNLEQEKLNEQFSKKLIDSPAYKNMMMTLMTMSATLVGSSDNSFSYFQTNRYVMLSFDDFFLQEILSLKEEQELVKFNRQLTKVYQSYMSQKFGRHYNDMKRAEYKRIYKEIRAEEENKTETLDE